MWAMSKEVPCAERGLRATAGAVCVLRRRAKNREAARKSRERKMMRLDSLQRSVADLQHENELLSGCVAEISQQAASAEAETRLMKVALCLHWPTPIPVLAHPRERCICLSPRHALHAHPPWPDAAHAARDRQNRRVKAGLGWTQSGMHMHRCVARHMQRMLGAIKP